MNNKENIAKLLIEAAGLLNNTDYSSILDSYDNEVITEGTILNELVEIITPLFLAFSVMVIPYIAMQHAVKKNAAKSAKAIDAEELSEAVKFLNDLEDKINNILKQSTYKKFVDKKIINIHSNFVDASKNVPKYFKHNPFNIEYCLFDLNFVKLAKEVGKYDEVIATDDRINEFLKKETEKIAKVVDKLRSTVMGNSFIKENFDLMCYKNNSQTILYCSLVLKQPIVFDTSKYLKK